MRVVTFAKLALFGTAVGAFVVGLRRSRRKLAPLDAELVPDPDDPVQSLQEVPPLHLEDLAVDARVEADDADASINGEGELEIETRAFRDAGELYGVHTVPAVDRDLPDDDQAFAAGENWLEALSHRAIENGSEPDRVLDFVDEDDLDSPPSDNRDRPVADRGSGGPRGL